MRSIRLAAVAALLVAGACSDDDPDTVDGSAREAAVIEAVVRSVAPEPASTDDDSTPVVYVVAADGREIPIDVQATVAAAFVDEVDLRFADDRSEAVDDGADGVPVLDDGTLVAIGEVPERGSVIEVPVERYVSELDNDVMVVTLRFADPDWTVTSTATVG